MPPQGTSSFGGMPPGKITKSTSVSKGEARRSSWNAASRKSSSKVTPKEPSPKQAASTTTEKRRSTSGASTPTKEPLKSCLKKPGSHSKSVPSSPPPSSPPPSPPPLSHRSECTQLSMRTDMCAFEQSNVLHDDDDDDDDVPKPVELEQQQLETPSTTPNVVADEPGARRREFPAAFVEAFARDEASVADSPHLGPYLVKLAKSYASGENPVKGLEYCVRAVEFYEQQSQASQQRENVLDLVISLHILAGLHCHLGQYQDASEILERSLTLLDLDGGGDEHALAAFNGHMQLGDTLSMVGKLAASLESYHRALDIQKSVLGEFDARVAETCVYVAEAHVQALEFAEAKVLCEHSLVIHTQHCEAGSVEEASDHRLLAIICSAQGEHSRALDSLVYANDIFVNFDLQIDVATGNQSIGEELLALAQDAEALQCFEKCLEDSMMLRGEHDALVASAHTSLANLFLHTNNPSEAKVHCQHALQIYARHEANHVPSDVAYGLVTIANILEQLNEKKTALLLLQRAFNIQNRIPGQQATVAGLQAQMGILQHMLHQFQAALLSFESAVAKMRSGTLRNSPLVGLVVNQMGVTSVELGDVPQAARFFEEAKLLLQSTAGPEHFDTLDVCHNLAYTYASLERIEEARDLLEEVVRVKEEKLGAVHPEVCEDRARLQALLADGQPTTYKRSRNFVEMLTSARKAAHTSK